MGEHKRSHSITVTLLKWFLVISMVPLLGVSWYAYRSTLASTQDMLKVKLEETSLSNAKQLKDRFADVYNNLGYWAQSPDQQRFFYQILAASEGKKPDEFVKSKEFEALQNSPAGRRLVRIKEFYPYIYDLFLIDLDGNILYTVEKESDLGTNLNNGAYAATRFAQTYRATFKDQKPYFSDIERYKASNGIIAGFMTMPMTDTNGKMVGIMAIQLNMDKLFNIFSDSKKEINGYLVGADGLLRTKINTQVFLDWHNEHVTGTHPESEEEHIKHYMGNKGVMVIGQHHAISLLGIKWVSISEVDEDAFMSVPNRLFETLAFVLLIALLGIFAVALFISRRLTRSIRHLSDASKRHINGERGVQVTIDATNEIGEFAEVFNKLIQKQEYDEDKLEFLAKKAQKTLDELKEQKYALDAHSIVAITDVKGTITFVNSKFEEITGYTSQELIGKNHRILNSGLHDIVFWKEMYHTVGNGAIWHGEVCNVAKNGSYYWVDTTIVPFLGEDGKPVSYIAIRTDITERKRIQDSLNEALALQKAVFENAGVSIITTDTQGLITSLNSAAETMLGYSADEMVGKQSPAIVHKLEEIIVRAQELTLELGEVVEPGFQVFVIKSDYNLPNTHEWTYVRKDGSELPVYLNVTALRDLNGMTNGYMGIASDVSLFKEAEVQMMEAKEAAESSARIKSEFLATMSHEIRTPINGVLGMLGLLEHTKLDESQKHQIRVASNSANSLLGLINDILDFSKVEAGKMELEMIEFNLRDELGEFVEAIAFRAQEKGLELILDTTKLTCLNVVTDPGRLRQILTNLIGNAVKFTHRGEILISVMMDKVDEHNGRLRIDVRDSGIGITPDKIDKLFQTFSQADNSTTRKYGGTGLGLAIVKKLCELMDGTIWITSVEYEGSTFHVDIGVGLGETSVLCLPSVSVAGKTVLVVDDNETNRAVVRAQLELWGMEVYEAEDPIIAFDNCQIRLSQGYIPPYDVALLDMQMPNMDGADLGAEIRQISACDGMKMVMMTSLGHRNDAARFSQIGFDAFFAKPTTAKDLLNALKVLFDEGAALEAANRLITKDFLGTLQDEVSEVAWPSNARILLVEDNPTNQIVAQGMLDMIGLEADIANNGLEALESMQLALDIVPYTIILMDCQMPEMDGYTASTAIREGRAGEAYKEIPIIAMTANAMAGDREKCLLSSMSDYVSKPINITTLKATLIKWMDAKINIERATRQAQVEKTPKSVEESRELKVWDEADALKRLGGKKELLHKIMQSFVDERERMMRELGDAVASGDLQNTQLHAHSIKGSSGNVSGQKVNALAKMLEFAAKNGDKSVLKEGFINLELEMDILIEVFQKELSKETQSSKRKKRIDPLQIAIQLQNLKKEIEMGTFIDTESFGIFSEYADEEFTQRMSSLKGHIDRFDSVEALVLLDVIMADLE